MKVSYENVRELQKHLEDLRKAIESLNKQAERWAKLQEDKMRWGSGDQYWISLTRSKLDRELDQIVDYLGWFYDYLHTERRALEVPTGKYLERIRNAEEGESGDLQPTGNDGSQKGG